MRVTLFGATACCFVSFCCVTAAAAMSIDAKAMARFDASYARCEAKYPEMRGARDEAYLGMWRVKPDDRTRAELAAVRKGAAYQAESRRVGKEPAKKEAQLEQQCQALWAETLRVRSLAR
jgi:hypothetical protein